jgi:hypothetical protein
LPPSRNSLSARTLSRLPNTSGIDFSLRGAGGGGGDKMATHGWRGGRGGDDGSATRSQEQGCPTHQAWTLPCTQHTTKGAHARTSPGTHIQAAGGISPIRYGTQWFAH